MRFVFCAYNLPDYCHSGSFLQIVQFQSISVTSIKVLPAAMFGMLVVYCYKNVDVLSGYYGLPDFIAGALVLGLHFWKKNMFLSISAGTIFYMFLVQKVFI